MTVIRDTVTFLVRSQVTPVRISKHVRHHTFPFISLRLIMHMISCFLIHFRKPVRGPVCGIAFFLGW
jgi:hypothetical protein